MDRCVSDVFCLSLNIWSCLCLKTDREPSAHVQANSLDFEFLKKQFSFIIAVTEFVCNDNLVKII